ncbi:MAG: Coenzyme F420 hydrogenase/dehydrogenase, beta subunit C-terminal domain [Candidatus Helarchaeota archaeon]
MELEKTYDIGTSKNIMELMKLFLKANIVESVLWFDTKKTRFDLAPKEITNPDDLTQDLLGQYCLYNYDRLDTTANFVRKKLDGAKNKKIAVIAKPCDIRAFIELSKVRQVNLDNILIVGIECPETINKKVLIKTLEKEGIDTEKIVGESRISVEQISFKLETGNKIIDIKDGLVYLNCTRCPRKISMKSDLNIGERGQDKWIVQIVSEKGKKAIDSVATDNLISGISEGENELVNKLIDISQQNRAADFEKLDAMTNKERFKLFYDTFSKCRKCASCINVCPVCFCHDCDLQRKTKLERADKKAGVENWEKMDRILYILTKMGHMCDSCIECGKCSQVCPVGIPSADTYRYINDKIQKKYGYVAGNSVDEMSPRSGIEIKKLLEALNK